MLIKKVKILEFAPTADEIWQIKKHKKDGYTDYNTQNGLVSLLDTTHEAKQRPQIKAVYAGGKATNVARVIDRLLPDNIQAEIELVTFLPPPKATMRNLNFGNSGIVPSTPAGIYTQCLQIENLTKIKPHFEVVDELTETSDMQTTRRCIEIVLEDAGTSLNFSPRMIWSIESAKAVLSRLASFIHEADMIVIAGAPPIWESSDNLLTPHNFYAKILNLTREDCQVSIDVRGYYLHDCLIAKKPPRFIFMNKDEFFEANDTWKELGGKALNCTLIVHNKEGCWVWDKKMPDGNNIFNGSIFFPAPKIEKVYSTIGAGDAMHAGFLREWIYSQGEADQIKRSVVYSQTVSAISVSNELATYGIDTKAVDDMLNSMGMEIDHGKQAFSRR
jgi:fructose-1-phosphate kinase PfkB-like protein